MEIPKEFYNMICADIMRADNAEQLPIEDQLRLHRELDGKYQACVKDWRIGLWGCGGKYDGIYYEYIQDSPSSILENLQMMKAKLETYKFQMNAIAMPNLPTTQVNVTSNVGINITFEEVRSQIEEMSSLTTEQTREVLAKISEIEEVVKSTDSKKSRWEKVKPVLK